MQTLPSLEALGELFACHPRVESEHAELGILKYEVEFDTEEDRITLSVLPIAEEVNISLFTKNPPRFVRLGLEDVSQVLVVNDDEEQKVEIHFHNTDVQTLGLRLRPVVMLLWGNQQDSPERHPPWECGASHDPS
jgi:hypothetical protein